MGVPYASHCTTASTTSTRKVALPWLFLINYVLSIFKLQIPIVRIMFIITILLQTTPYSIVNNLFRPYKAVSNWLEM